MTSKTIPPEDDDTEDMAAVGRALMDAIEAFSHEPPLKGWAPAQCPSEIVGDLVNMLEEATQPDREAIIEACANLLDLGTQDILLISGEMSAQEIRSVRAMLNERARAIRSLKHSDTTPEGGENG